VKQKQRLSDLKVMSKDQLEHEFLNLKKEQFNLRFQRATGQLENTAGCGSCAAISRELNPLPRSSRVKPKNRV